VSGLSDGTLHVEMEHGLRRPGSDLYDPSRFAAIVRVTATTLAVAIVVVGGGVDGMGCRLRPTPSEFNGWSCWRWWS
jgi:hypothetical protein